MQYVIERGSCARVCEHEEDSAMTRPKDIDGIEIPRIPSSPPPTEEEHRRMVEVLEELRI